MFLRLGAECKCEYKCRMRKEISFLSNSVLSLWYHFYITECLSKCSNLSVLRDRTSTFKETLTHPSLPPPPLNHPRKSRGMFWGHERIKGEIRTFPLPPICKIYNWPMGKKKHKRKPLFCFIYLVSGHFYQPFYVSYRTVKM